MTEQPTRSYEKDYNAQVDVWIEMNLDVLQIKRQNYDVLQLLSDIGGI